MLTIHISFNGDANRGSFAIDAIAETIGGDWSSKGCTDDSGTVTNVDSGNREWVEELLNNDEQVEITGNPPTKLYALLTKQKGSIIVIAERGEEPHAFPVKSAELREHNPDAPILLAGGRWLIAPNEDATNAAILNVTSTDERVAWAQAEALKIVVESGVKFDEPVKLLPMAKILSVRTGYSTDKAKQQIAKAMRRLRGEYVAVARGGWREGAGRPTESE